jgi:hypothetical protein
VPERTKEKQLMGMYTEVFLRAALRADVPAEAMTAIECIVGLKAREGEILPDHPLFACPRWEQLGSSGSYYFPDGAESSISYDELRGGKSLVVHGNIKNYDDEIAKLFDWIDPYLNGSEGDFIGFELYEEDTEPTMHHKGRAL